MANPMTPAQARALAASGKITLLDVRELAEVQASGLAKGAVHPVRPFPAQGLEPVDNPGLFWSLAFAIRRSTFQRIGGFHILRVVL